MIVYLASSFRQTKEQMRQCAASLAVAGVRVTSRWIYSTAHGDPLDKPDACTDIAAECLADVDAADTVVYFTEHGSTGKHIEFGYALARSKRIVVVGNPSSVFQFLPGVERYPTFADFMLTINTEVPTRERPC